MSSSLSSKTGSKIGNKFRDSYRGGKKGGNSQTSEDLRGMSESQQNLGKSMTKSRANFDTSERLERQSIARFGAS